MGCIDTITRERFPEQGDWLGRRVRVVFHYGTADTAIGGVIVRDDREAPHERAMRWTTWRALRRRGWIRLHPDAPWLVRLTRAGRDVLRAADEGGRQ